MDIPAVGFSITYEYCELLFHDLQTERGPKDERCRPQKHILRVNTRKLMERGPKGLPLFDKTNIA